MNLPERESTTGTLAFAAAVAFCCALMVSLAVWWLRPIQLAQVATDHTRAVLATAGLVKPAEVLSDREVVRRFLQFEVLLVDLQSHDFSKRFDAATYDYRSQFGAAKMTEPRYMPLYLLRDKGRIGTVVLPVIADGMWSTIHGFVALEADLTTIAGVNFYDHGETPGIGDRIQSPQWQAQWVGRRLFDSAGDYRFRIRSNPDPLLAAFSVDAITGATVTVSAVDRAMSRWFGSAGYGPVLTALRERQ